MGLFDKLFGRNDAPASETAAISELNKAVALYRKGAYAEALQAADRLIAAGPEVALSWRFRGECLFALGRFADAVTAFDKASAIGGPGTDDTFLWAVLALHNGGQSDQAKARLRQVLAKPNLPAALRARTEDALAKLETPPA